MTAQWSVEQGVTPKPRLLDEVRNRIRAKHYSRRTEQSYTHWIKRFILFHGKRHPNDMGAKEVEAFLSSLAVDRNVSASTQRQALAAILFFRAKMGSVLEASDDTEAYRRLGDTGFRSAYSPGEHKKRRPRAPLLR